MYDYKTKLIILLLLLTLVFSLFTIFIHSESMPGISAASAALYEPETDSFIYLKEANKRLGMASTTKIMTALLALEMLPHDEIISVDGRACGIEGSSVYLEEGEELSAKDLVYALLLQSANDAAAALAYRISNSIEAFADLMNERAYSLGLENTNFTNPHGLDSENHYTTAHDLAIITAEALNNQTFREIASTYKKEIVSSEKTRICVNHNKLLKSYEGCIGIKTGYTKKCGRCLVSAAERDGLTLISVTINAPDDWRDHTEMLNYGYSLLEARVLAKAEQYTYKIPVLGGKDEFVTVSNENAVKMILPKNSASIKSEVRLSRYICAPVNKGDILGTVVFTLDNKEIARVCLTAKETVTKQKKSGFNPFDKFKKQ
jgi:D-alanyl-D-alanine carboxypeptidase/D-alanyl-D-alanine carboxypeptidase (penicillin-binding protein 5/6)